MDSDSIGVGSNPATPANFLLKVIIMERKITSESFEILLTAYLLMDVLLTMLVFGFREELLIFIPVLILLCISTLLIPFIVEQIVDLKELELRTLNHD